MGGAEGDFVCVCVFAVTVDHFKGWAGSRARERNTWSNIYSIKFSFDLSFSIFSIFRESCSVDLSS